MTLEETLHQNVAVCRECLRAGCFLGINKCEPQPGAMEMPLLDLLRLNLEPINYIDGSLRLRPYAHPALVKIEPYSAVTRAKALAARLRRAADRIEAQAEAPVKHTAQVTLDTATGEITSDNPAVQAWLDEWLEPRRGPNWEYVDPDNPPPLRDGTLVYR